MIIIKNKGKGRQIVYFPKNSNTDALVDLYLKNCLTNEEYCFEGLKDIGLMGNYYQLEVDLSSVEDGEFEYRLPNEIGLLRLGNLRPDKISYEAEKTIKEYKYGE